MGEYMRNLLIVGLFLMSTGAFASTSGTLLLVGNVAGNLSINITPSTDAVSLNIIDGETNKSVASVQEKSNLSNGYKVYASSTNGGKLKHSSIVGVETTYQLKYGNGSYVTLSTGNTQLKNVSTLNGLTTTIEDVKINVTALPNALEGSYSDTVTLSIVAN